MNRLAICLTGVAFVIGCSATNGADDGVAPPGNEQPGTEQLEAPVPEDAGAPRIVPVTFEPAADADTGIAPVPIEDTGGAGDADDDGGSAADTATPENPEDDSGQDGGGTSEDGGQTPEPEQPPPAVPTEPRVIDGNPTCAEAFEETTVSFTATPKGDGATYAVDGATVTLTYAGGSVDVTSTRLIVGIIVKGGAAANVYSLMAESATGLTTPYGHEISHVTICFAPPVL